MGGAGLLWDELWWEAEGAGRQSGASERSSGALVHFPVAFERAQERVSTRVAGHPPAAKIPTGPHGRARSLSVVLLSGWFRLTLAQCFRVQPAFFGRPLVRRFRLLRVRAGLYRTVLVVAGCTRLAASIGVLVLNWSGRSFLC